MKGAFALLAAIGLIALVGCSSDTRTPTSSKDTAVRTSTVDLPKSYRFAPRQIEVSAGTTVTWTNSDNFVHNVHLLDAPGTSKDLPVGGKATITFDRAGTYRYQCSLHPAQMKGTVIVSA